MTSPVTTTAGNSSPFAPWIVSSRTPGRDSERTPPFASASLETQQTSCDRRSSRHRASARPRSFRGYSTPMSSAAIPLSLNRRTSSATAACSSATVANPRLAATASGHYRGAIPEAISIDGFAKVLLTAPDGSSFPVALGVREDETLAGGSAPNFSAALRDAESATLVIPAADLAQFVGPGTFSLSVAGTPRLESVEGLMLASGILFGSQGSGSVEPRGYGAVTVSYQYATPERPAAVPEPGSFILLATGLSGLIAHARSRRRGAIGSGSAGSAEAPIDSQ